MYKSIRLIGWVAVVTGMLMVQCVVGVTSACSHQSRIVATMATLNTTVLANDVSPPVADILVGGYRGAGSDGIFRSPRDLVNLDDVNQIASMASMRKAPVEFRMETSWS